MGAGTLRRACFFLWSAAIILMPSVRAAEKAAANDGWHAGIVFVVGGVGGFDLLGSGAQWALPKAGIKHEIKEFCWTHGTGRVFRDLQDHRHLMSKAVELADEVRKIKEETPDRPVYLVGKSGGAGLVLAAAEQLPPATLERIILLSAAVSTTYDLRPAFRATKCEIVSFYSIYDNVILDWGTTTFGTIDRYYVPSAGCKAFTIPKDLSADDQALYDRLVEIPWKPAMIPTGYWGGHLGTSMPAFVAKEVGPWLLP
jgi:hypothetical protein